MKHGTTGFGADLVDLRGAVDMHIHSHPCMFPRLTDDFEVAVAARDAGLRAIVLKCHHESTVSRAYYTRTIVPDIEVYGGIVLNSYVGYVNPAAVDAALRFGGKVVWMPTSDAGYHAQIHGSTGNYGTQAGGIENADGYWVLEDGKLKDEVVEVLKLIAEHNAVLATCHLSPAEIVALVERARKEGVEKILITHPFYKVPNLDMATLEHLCKLGAIAEFIYTGVSPFWAAETVDNVANAIRHLGADRCILVSDSGQRHNPVAPEALRLFAQMMLEKGISQDDISLMIRETPAALLDLDKGPAVRSPVEISRLGSKAAPLGDCACS
ncbi:DUF6282 family protein [Amycolatopsis jejuensis]|uniref:DUF6282 family protein n=1 Tax=Amycolatopsis jejuensis TaxID=330084 RepID=UPI00068E4D92|nr:DUF6282 family protein [Amycolatopsis jejuensis]